MASQFIIKSGELLFTLSRFSEEDSPVFTKASIADAKKFTRRAAAESVIAECIKLHSRNLAGWQQMIANPRYIYEWVPQFLADTRSILDMWQAAHVVELKLVEVSEPLQESLVDQVRQLIELKTGCDANGRCGADCPCESAARAAIAVVETEIAGREREECAKVADAVSAQEPEDDDAAYIAAAIRARGAA
jgi:hypothetical protein